MKLKFKLKESISILFVFLFSFLATSLQSQDASEFKAGYILTKAVETKNAKHNVSSKRIEALIEDVSYQKSYFTKINYRLVENGPILSIDAIDVVELKVDTTYYNVIFYYNSSAKSIENTLAKRITNGKLMLYWGEARVKEKEGTKTKETYFFVKKLKYVFDGKDFQTDELSVLALPGYYQDENYKTYKEKALPFFNDNPEALKEVNAPTLTGMNFVQKILSFYNNK